MQHLDESGVLAVKNAKRFCPSEDIAGMVRGYRLMAQIGAKRKPTKA